MAEQRNNLRAESYLAPQTLAQLAPFELRAKMIIEGVTSGMHRSPYQGMAVEFAEYRQYAPGDDLRHLDWKVYGRSDKLYIKQYQQETNLDVVLLVDGSASMGFGSLNVKGEWGGTKFSEASGHWTKFDAATALATAFAYLCIGQADRIGLAVFSDEVHSIVPRSSGQQQWRRIVNSLAVEPSRTDTDFPKMTEQVLSKVRNRALFVMISDFFSDPEEIRRSLARFRHRRHDVVLLNVLDRAEMRFHYDEPSPFEGMEDEGRLRIDPRALRDGYLDALRSHLDKVQSLATSFGFDYQRIDSHSSVGPALAYLLAQRQIFSRRSSVR